MDELINHTLGGYQIIEQIGIGGMATVYKAYQANMDRYVAVKVLPRQLAEDPNFLARFEQEARTIARLENKNILPVYDYGTQDGYTYLVMRYVGQGTLKDLTSQGPLPLPTVVDFLEQIAEALQYAHDKGVIHRDVKTSNVLIDEHQQCYLTDFGIAKLAASSAHFTASGALIGTPAYMSPEQCSGMAVDHRSDLYSLGIVLYEMLTGAVPYQAETPVAIVLMHMQSPLPSPRQLNPNIPEPVEQVVFRALAKSPDERFQSAYDFAQTLRQALEKATDSATLSLPRSQATPYTPAAVEAAHPVTPTQLSAPTTPTPHQVRTFALRLSWKRVLVGALLILLVLIVLGTLSDRREQQRSEDQTTATAVDESALDETPQDSAALVATPTQMPTETPFPTDTLEPTAAPTLRPTRTPTHVPTVAVPPTESSLPEPPPEAENEFVLDVFTTTRGRDETDRHIALTRGGIWISSHGGLEFWTWDGDSFVYTSADGLLFNSIQTLSVDREGALWLLGGDTPGIMRLLLSTDGNIDDIQVFTSENTNLNSDYAWALYPERGGVLVGTYETLIEAWNEDRGWYQPDFPTQGSNLRRVGDRVWALMRTRDGTLWAGGPVGIALLSPEADDWQVLGPPPQLRGEDYEALAYTHFYADRADDALWVFGYTDPSWQPFVGRLAPSDDPEMPWQWVDLPVSLPTENVLDILRTADDTLWIVTPDQVVHYMPDGTRGSFTRDDGLPGDTFLHLAADKDGVIWLTSDIGLAAYEDGRWNARLSPDEVPFHDAVAMGEDSDGKLWFVSPYGDLMMFSGEWWDFMDAFDTQIFDMRIVNDVWWFATDQGLLRWEDGITRRYTIADGLADDLVLTLAIDPQNDTLLWVGTANGLTVLDTETDAMRTWRPENDTSQATITLMYADWRGRLWVGVGTLPDEETSDRRPALYLRGRPQENEEDLAFTWTPIAQAGDPFDEDETAILSLALDRRGVLWVGTDSMLYRYADDTWTRYDETVDEQAPMYTPMRAIYASSERVLVGTEHDGLFFYDGERWHALGMAGVGSPAIQRITRTSDGALWILSRDGITRVRGDMRHFAGE